jgi:hypothetical protein
MVADGEIVFFGHLLLQLFDAKVLEFYDFTAFSADQVIMMLTAMRYLVKGLSGAEIALLRQAAFCQKLERSVNGGVADMGMLFADFQIKFLSRQMGLHPKEFIQNDLSLACEFESLLADILSEYLAFFGHAPSSEIEYQSNRVTIRVSSSKTAFIRRMVATDKDNR